MRISSASLALALAAAALSGSAAEARVAASEAVSPQEELSPGRRFHRLARGRLTPAALPAETQAILVYHGASWCRPCRAFVPELVAAYPRLRARGIEVLFVSDDATCVAAQNYARASRMPWLLLPCDRKRQRRLRALGGTALPGAVLIDRAGRVQATSWHADGSSTPRGLLSDILGHAR